MLGLLSLQVWSALRSRIVIQVAEMKVGIRLQSIVVALSLVIPIADVTTKDLMVSVVVCN